MTASEPRRHRIESAEDELFVVFDGVRIAKYGKPLSGYFGQWISLEPGYEVFTNADHSEIVINKHGVRVH
jgi:hypothetical protein